MRFFAPARLVWQEYPEASHELVSHNLTEISEPQHAAPVMVEAESAHMRMINWEVILEQLSMNRRTFLQLASSLGLGAALSMMSGCLPPLPDEDWKLPERIDQQNPLFMELADNRERHDGGDLNKENDLPLLFSTIQNLYTKELGSEYTQLRDEYVQYAIGEIKGFEGILKLLLDNQFGKDHPEIIDEFPNAWANFLPTFEKYFPQILDRQFTYLLGTFDPYVLLEFMQHLKKKRFGAGFLRKIFLGDDENGLDKDRVDIHEIKQSFFHGVVNPNHVRGERMKQYIPSLLMYVMTKDLVPSMHETLGGRALASWASTMACFDVLDVVEVDADGKGKVNEDQLSTPKQFYAPQNPDTKAPDHFQALTASPYLDYQAVVPFVFSSAELTMDQKRQLFFGFKKEDYEHNLKPYIFEKKSQEAAKAGTSADIDALGLEAAKFIKKKFTDLNAEERKDVEDFMMKKLEDALQRDIDQIIALHKARYDATNTDFDELSKRYFQQGSLKYLLNFIQKQGAREIIKVLQLSIPSYHTQFVEPVAQNKPRPDIAANGDMFFSNMLFDGNDLAGHCEAYTPQIERETHLHLPKLVECAVS